MKVFLQLLKMRILSVFKGSGKKDKYKKIADALMNAGIQRTFAIFMCIRLRTMGSEPLVTLQALLRPFPVPWQPDA